MRALIVIDVEVEDGKRPGTRYARLEWVAESVARFVGFQKRIRTVNIVEVHPGEATAAMPAVPLMRISGETDIEEAVAK
ncbi:MAG: hypothetical protein GY788_15555 [bacterium]|nr:hypothetical protein [bacterium]